VGCAAQMFTSWGLAGERQILPKRAGNKSKGLHRRDALNTREGVNEISRGGHA